MLCAIAVVAACGGGRDGNGDDDSGGDGEVPSTDGGTAGSGAEILPMCLPSCVTAADCGSDAPGTIIDADNYACDEGVCRWTGCRSTDECTTSYQSSRYTCGVGLDSDVPSCLLTCSTAADCALPSPLHDADNYACEGTRCRWKGCNSTAECMAANQSAGWTCLARSGAATKNCWMTCTSVADCAVASAPYDADNYRCDAGVCVWTGCNSTAECMTVDASWVCDR